VVALLHQQAGRQFLVEMMRKSRNPGLGGIRGKEHDHQVSRWRGLCKCLMGAARSLPVAEVNGQALVVAGAMNKAETLAGLAVVAIGAAILVQAKNLPYMLEDVPGPGFLPLWISFGILGVGVFLTAQAIRTQTATTGPVQWPDARGWRRVGLMLAALAISLFALDWLGFLLTTTLFMGAWSLRWARDLGVRCFSRPCSRQVSCTWFSPSG
jgi:hypothetical protein